uniref:Uncharacterized protein n=1 Tax=viral metagenome TaxID=1070528 RepID=A0A6M3K2W3_9ZZZZ
MANTVHLKGSNFRVGEAVASVAAYPGYLMETDSNGEVKPHATEGGYAARMIANEDAMQGNTLTDQYAIDDLVQLLYELPGNEVRMYLEAGQTAVIGSRLISAGNGTLKLESDATSAGVVKQIIGIALEAKDLSDSAAVDTLIDVELY